MPRLFISYRREDSIAYAGRLYDRLIAHFGKTNVFMDVDTIEPGADFVEVLKEVVANCDILLAVIGRRWLEANDERGQRRLTNPGDFVRLEIVAALERNVRVIPILVGDAKMPGPGDLPTDLLRLARRQAIDLRDVGFHAGVDKLIKSVESPQALQRQEVPEKPAEKRPRVEARAPGRAQSEPLSHAEKQENPEQQKEHGPKGTDINYQLHADFWQAIRGANLKMEITRQIECPDCLGRGHSPACSECLGSGQVTQLAGAMRFTLTCPRCVGAGSFPGRCDTCNESGHARVTETITLRIPPGTPQGALMRIAGKGNVGTNGTSYGDLYVTALVEEDPLFHREGDDIRVAIPVTFEQARLGATVDVPTIDGTARMKLPSGTADGQMFRLRGQGVPNRRTGVRGDQIVKIYVLANPV